jgi:hypothetical protein
MDEELVLEPWHIIVRRPDLTSRAVSVHRTPSLFVTIRRNSMTRVYMKQLLIVNVLVAKKKEPGNFGYHDS